MYSVGGDLNWEGFCGYKQAYQPQFFFLPCQSFLDLTNTVMKLVD